MRRIGWKTSVSTACADEEKKWMEEIHLVDRQDEHRSLYQAHAVSRR